MISGPSGVGKGTLVARVMERLENPWLSVSMTTRDPRPGEIDGISYRFVSVAQFEDLVEQDGFLEWAHVHADYYGTPRAAVEEHLDEGCTVIVEIDFQGAFQVRDKMPEAHLIFIDAPNLEVIESRLRGRGTETEEVVAKRMKQALVEISHKMEYDYILVNDDLDEATEKLLEHIEEVVAGEGC